MSINALNSLVRQDRQRIERINQVVAGNELPDEEVADLRGDIVKFFDDNDAWMKMTNFTRTEVESIFKDMSPSFASARRRGPVPDSTNGDALLCFLAWGKLGVDYGSLSVALGLKETRLLSNIERVRPILREFLEKKWWSNRIRPTALLDTNFPYVALLIDGHSTEVFRPKTSFAEAKHYWDGKNKIYAIKNEVAVMAAAPHYALFASRGVVGSVHDYALHKEIYPHYLEYLLKLPNEVAAIPGDRQQRSWAVLGDKAYTGPARDTPNERRVHVMKNASLQADVDANREKSRLRVPNERYFGRLTLSWGVMRNVYRWDHSHFDADFCIFVLLTNELIRAHQLEEQDREAYLKFVKSRIEHCDAVSQKRHAQHQASIQRKKARLGNLIHNVEENV